MRLFYLISILFFFSLSYRPVVFAQDDSVIVVIDDAKSSYLRGDWIYTLKNLQTAVKLVQQGLVEKLTPCFPEPSKKWHAMAIESTGDLLTGRGNITLRRKYYQDQVSSTILIEFLLNATKAATIRSWLRDPSAMQRSIESAEIGDINGLRSIQKYDSYQQVGEVYLVPSSILVIKVTGDYVKDLTPVLEFTRIINLDRLMKIF